MEAAKAQNWAVEPQKKKLYLGKLNGAVCFPELCVARQYGIKTTIPVTGHGSPCGCETSRLQHFLDIGSQMAVRLSAVRADHPLRPGRFLVFISVRG
jgi:hypothetical protein